MPPQATPAMNGLRPTLARLANDYPVALFAPLALVLSWGVWVGVFSATPAWSPAWLLGAGVGAWGPGIAGVVVLRLRGDSVRSWLSDGFRTDSVIRSMALAIGVPAVVTVGVAAAVFAFVGVPNRVSLGQLAPQLVASFVLTTLWTGGNEEFGWRGFALPHLQEQYSALVSGLLVGGLWTVWHAPLFVYGLYTMPPAVYAVSVLALSVALTWYYNTTDGWILGAILFHGSVNTFLNLPPQVVGGEEALNSLPIPYFGVVAVVMSGLGGILLLRYGHETLTDGDIVGRTWTDRGSASNTDSTGEAERGRSHAAEG
jgi:membrane protease YdiL (CAAX protease family)